MTALKIAGIIVGASGAVTIFLSVFAFGILFFLALIPLLIGVFQAGTGIRLLVRGTQTGPRPYLAAGAGILLGVVPLQAAGTQAWPQLLGLLLVGGNALAIWLLMQASRDGNRPTRRAAPTIEDPE